MLVVVLAAGLFPNAGTVQAQSSCAYPPCPTTSSVPVWEYVSILVIVALAAIVALLFIMRRRRPPRPAPGPPTSAAGGAPAPLTPWSEGPAPPGGAAPAPYIETPEDVGHAPPTVPTAPPAGGTAPPPGAAAGAEPSSDIDSLMAELDKISTEILKKQPKKPPGGSSGDESETGGSDQ